MLIWFLLVAALSAIFSYYEEEMLASVLLASAVFPAAMKWVFRL
jgi:hypothetical protein